MKTIKEVAAYCNCSKSTVNRAIKELDIPTVKELNRQLVDTKDIETIYKHIKHIESAETATTDSINADCGEKTNRNEVNQFNQINQIKTDSKPQTAANWNDFQMVLDSNDFFRLQLKVAQDNYKALEKQLETKDKQIQEKDNQIAAMTKQIDELLKQQIESNRTIAEMALNSSKEPTESNIDQQPPRKKLLTFWNK